jgi:hypothetical protein
MSFSTIQSDDCTHNPVNEFNRDISPDNHIFGVGRPQRSMKRVAIVCQSVFNKLNSKGRIPMTKQEHMLMMSMFATQLQLTLTLANLLKSREIATDDDLRAFADLTLQSGAEAMAAIMVVYV